MEEVFNYLRKIFKPIATCQFFNELPKEGIPKQEILDLLSKILNKENYKWEKGFVSGAVYHGEKDHIDFLNNVYAIKKILRI